MKEQMNKYAEKARCLTYMKKITITVLHTKFEASSFNSSWEIFDQKINIGLYGDKEERKNKWTNKPRKPIVS